MKDYSTFDIIHKISVKSRYLFWTALDKCGCRIAYGKRLSASLGYGWFD